MAFTFGATSHGCILTGTGKNLHAIFITNLGQTNALCCVYIDHDFTILIIVLYCTVPDRIDHDYVFSCLHSDFLIEEGKHESIAEPRVDKLSSCSHQYYVEVGGIKLLSLLLESIFHKPVTLLKDRDGESML